MKTVLTINDISKRFGNIQALNKVSFSVPEGSVFGILGPNGSGKTTLLGIVMDIVKSNGGNYLWFGKQDNGQVRKKIGTLLETPNFYNYLTAEQNLQITAEIKDYSPSKSHIDNVLRLMDLYERKAYPFSTYSLGMKQRLAIAACLIGNPDVLVFDEPTNGLDPVGIADIRALIKKLQQEGKTIIIASHLLDEIEKVCTHVAILQKGKLITSGPIDEVLSSEDIVEVGSSDLNHLFTVLQNFPGTVRVKRDDSVVKVYFPKGQAQPEQIFQYCSATGTILNHLRVCRKSLETSFFELINNN